MPEGHDSQNGRMLFTDFDASDKGRPVSPVDVNTVPGLAGPLPTLADIALSLELDFEEDGDADVQPHASGSANGDGDKTDTKNFQQNTYNRNGDQELSLDEPDSAGGEKKAESSIYAVPDFSTSPTWEEFTRAFQQSPHIDTSGEPFPRPPDPAVDSHAGAADMALLDEDGVDVLSMLTSMAEDAFSVHPVPPPPSVPYGGVERVDDWYDPPENLPDAVARIDNWYETPRDQAAEPDGGWLSAWRSEMASGDELRKPTRRIERPTGAESEEGKAAARQPGHDTTVELFAGIDVDHMWEEKLQQRRDRKTPESDTRQLDLFNDLDLDNLWEQRSRQADGLPSASGDGSDDDGGRTVIMNTGDLQNADTAILPDGFYRSKTRTTVKISAHPEAAAKPLSKEPKTDRSPTESGDATAVLDEPDDLAAAENDDPDAAAQIAKKTTDDPLAFLADFDEEWDEEAENAVAAPVVGDGDLLEPVGKPGKRSRAKAKRATARDGEKSANTERHAASGEDADAAFPGAGNAKTHDDAPYPHDGGEAEEEDYIPDVRDEGEEAPPARRGLTTDDLLNDVDFDQYGVDSSVSAPVIDDSAIDEVARRRGHGTEELAAIIDQGGLPDTGDEDTEEEEQTDSVPVNPLDVFANMDDMDFSDDVDDDMRAMMEEDEESEDAPSPDAATAENGESALYRRPSGFLGRARRYADAGVRKVVPTSLLERLQRMIAWRENWWFYCDLAAAIIASASLAVIISYWVWYRN